MKPEYVEALKSAMKTMYAHPDSDGGLRTLKAPAFRMVAESKKEHPMFRINARNISQGKW